MLRLEIINKLMASSMVDRAPPPPPPSFFLSTHSDMSPNIILRKNGPTKSNADFIQTVEGHLFEKKT